MVVYRITLLLLLVSSGGFSQSGDILVDRERAQGIYVDFESFRYNSPENSGKLSFFQADKSDVSVGARKNFLLVENGEKIDTVDQGIWGVNFGSGVYILKESDSVRPAYYIPLQYIGRYCFYTDEVIFSVDGAMNHGNPLLRNTKIEHYIININNGKRFKLDDKLMHAILDDDQELLKQYKKEKNRKKTYLQYIKSYSKRHPEQIK